MMKANSCPSKAPGGPVSGGEGRRWEQGQTLVLAALLMIVLVGALALVVDVGNAYTQRRLAQNAADAAALAGVRALALEQTTAEIDAAVDEYAVKRNRGQSYEMAVLSRTVAVTITKTFPTIFAAAVGSPTMTVVAVAEGVYKFPPILDGLVPLAVDKDSIPADKKQFVQIWDTDKYPSSPGIISGGERGWLNFTNDDAGANMFESWIVSGYGGDVYTEEACQDMGSTDPNCAWILGIPGSKSTGTDKVAEVYAPWDEKKRLMIVPVFDTVRPTEYVEPPENVDKLDYHIVGFAAFKVTTVVLEKASDEYPAHVKKIKGYFADYVSLDPSGGDGEYDFGVRVIGLQR